MYIKHTLHCGFFYEAKSQLQVHGYTDANWDGNVSNRRSTNGFMFSFGNGAISWSSKKQPTVTLHYQARRQNTKVQQLLHVK